MTSKLSTAQLSKIKQSLEVKSPTRPPKEDRLNWLLDWVGSSPSGVDVLDAEFVELYLDYSLVSYEFTMYGAHRCKQLTRDLSELASKGYISKGVIRVPPMSGFPTRVNTYRLSPQTQEVFDNGLRFWPTR